MLLKTRDKKKRKLTPAVKNNVLKTEKKSVFFSFTLVFILFFSIQKVFFFLII